MTNAENMDAVVAFNKAQANMGKAIRDAKNSFLNNSYATLEAVQAAVFPPFQEQGFAILQCGGADEHGQYVSTILHHSSGHLFQSKVYLELKKGDMQSVGSAITYARRYGLTMITGVPTTDDDGNAAVGEAAMKDKVVAKAKGLRTFLKKGPTEAQMIERGPDANALLKQLKSIDKELHDEIETLWNINEKQLGIN